MRALSQVGLEGFAGQRLRPSMPAPTLKQLLAPDEQQRLLSVEEQARRST